MSSYSARERPMHISAPPLDLTSGVSPAAVPAVDPITVMIVVPTLDIGAAEINAVELVRILKGAGHHAIVVARAGRLLADITAAGAEFIPLNVASKNPLVMLRNAAMLINLAREHHCDVIHALGGHTFPVPRRLLDVAALGTRLPLVPTRAQWISAGRVATLMDTAKARRELRWRPRYDSRETLRALVSAE